MNTNDAVPQSRGLKKRLDWIITLIPFFAICNFMFPVYGIPPRLRFHSGIHPFFLGDQLGSYYLLLGLGALICSFYMAFSRYGKIKLGNLEKPQYSPFRWGSMMFTAGLAADILFYRCASGCSMPGNRALRIWGPCRTGPPPTSVSLGPIPWSFYMILAVCFGFMIHVRKRSKQKYSEACRALLGKRVDGIWGKLIDLTAVFALLAGTATTFSLATPLLSAALSRVFGVGESNVLTIAILIIICVVYTLAVYFGMEGIAKLAASCVYLFFVLLAYFFLLGGETRFIIETGITAIGNLTQNFIGLSTWTDALRTSSFPQTWTIFYWAYWMVWCVATPFFIGTISKGRTIRQTVLGGYFFGLAGTFTSFIILGNYGLGLQMHGRLDLMGLYAKTGDLYQTIIAVFETMPLAKAGLALLAVTMIAFYATSFDALTMVASSYSYKALGAGEEPDKAVKLFWAIMLMLLPIALIFAKNSMANLQTVSIIAAFPIGFIIILIVWSFFKDAGNYLKGE